MPMFAEGNRRIYRRWAPVYDALMGPLYARGRRRAIAVLDPRAGERVFAPGIGTGLDIDSMPEGVKLTGLDFSPEMLARARERARGHADVELVEGDAQSLPFPDASFDAVLCNLVLSVVPDGNAAFREAWRVLRSGGRLAIFDKFIPEKSRVGFVRRVVGAVAERVGTDVNRRFDDVVAGVSGLTIVSDEPAMLGGQYRVILLRKE